MKYITYIVLVIGIGLQLSTPQTAQAQRTERHNQFWSMRSMDIGITDRGFNAGATWRHPLSNKWWVPAQFSFLFYRDSDDVRTRYDYYYYPYYEERESKKILLLQLRTGLQHRLWTESLAENMQPYLFVTGGPTLAFDPANSGGFFKRWQKTQFAATGHLFAGAAVDFVYSREGQFTLTIGYEAIYFLERIDGAYNYSGVVIGFSFGERLR